MANRYRIGKFDETATVYRPKKARVAKYLDTMRNEFKDYDIYLWGSYPQKKTWDVDLLAHNPDMLSTEEMSNINLKSLRTGLLENNLLVDLGFTEKVIEPFSVLKDRYINEGKATASTGYVYGDKWYMNDKLLRDRTKAADYTEGYLNGSLEYLGNDMFAKRSEIPYLKMINSIYNGSFDKWYRDKPMLIKERKKIYG